MNPLERLRYHVTGAIERGEKEPMLEIRSNVDSLVMPTHAVGYMSGDMKRVTSSSGETIGENVQIVSSWAMPHSFVSPRQYQIEVTINGRRYTGRTMGAGMLWRGKAKK